MTFSKIATLLDLSINFSELSIQQLYYLADAATYCASFDKNYSFHSAFCDLQTHDFMPSGFGKFLDELIAVSVNLYDFKLLCMGICVKCAFWIFARSEDPTNKGVLMILQSSQKQEQQKMPPTHMGIYVNETLNPVLANIPLSTFFVEELDAILQACSYLLLNPGAGNLADALREEGTEEIFSDSVFADFENLPSPSRLEVLNLVKQTSQWLIEIEIEQLEEAA